MTEATPTPPVPDPRPRRPWTRVLLVASLGLNLAFVGLMAGLALKGPPGPHGPGGDPGLRFYGDALPEPYRGELGRSLRASRGEWVGQRQRLRGLRADLAAALTAEPYDPAAVSAVLDDGTGIMAALGRRGTGLLLEQIGRMDAEARAEYARRLMEPPRPGPGGKGPGGPRH
ncbi:periplasmic heavy metal sensor [Amaricoccus sp.]|uniref:periplasmic heavy metal sensor n=1 Tax=Amaricoccus sp. TaxID=1872485 RepID=UPI001B7A6558|nr:periplasmic heavy metal sensor [Amaricoccus sp.]MBP7243483.1 periplasmic heavy metal sensor [Amaricoccus sp.]